MNNHDAAYWTSRRAEVVAASNITAATWDRAYEALKHDWCAAYAAAMAKLAQDQCDLPPDQLTAAITDSAARRFEDQDPFSTPKKAAEDDWHEWRTAT